MDQLVLVRILGVT